MIVRPNCSGDRGARLGSCTRRAAAMMALGVAAYSASACRGKLSTSSPILLSRDMHDQPYFRPERRLPGEPNGASARALPLFVVSRESAVSPGTLELGSDNQGFAVRAPVRVDEKLLARGEVGFNIYCSACHDRAGSGQGVNPRRGFPGPIDLASDNTRRLRDGQIFEIIARGIRNMPPMGDQIPIPDRWPIVVWVRVLQRSQHAKISDVEPRFVSTILPEESN